MKSYNLDALYKFGVTGLGSVYSVCTSIYGWQIRERYDMGHEHTIFRAEGHTHESYNKCIKEVQQYIDAGYGVTIYPYREWGIK